jgi:hypothetical protein
MQLPCVPSQPPTPPISLTADAIISISGLHCWPGSAEPKSEDFGDKALERWRADHKLLQPSAGSTSPSPAAKARFLALLFVVAAAFLPVAERPGPILGKKLNQIHTTGLLERVSVCWPEGSPAKPHLPVQGDGPQNLLKPHGEGACDTMANESIHS